MSLNGRVLTTSATATFSIREQVLFEKYGGPVGRGYHDMHIRDLRTCTHAHLGFADLHILDLRTCTYSICGRAHMHIWDLRTCTYSICGRAHMHIWDLRTCMERQTGQNYFFLTAAIMTIESILCGHRIDCPASALQSS